MVKTINVSKNNSTFQKIEALKNNKTKRHQEKLFFVEGVQNIKEAINNNWKIKSFIYSNYDNLSNWAKSILDLSEVNYVLSQELIKILSDKEDTSEILALVEMKEQEINYSDNPLILLFDRPSKKGNLGTILRSCDALFVDEFIFTGHSVDIYDPTVISSSMGSFFKVPFRYIDTKENFETYYNNLIKKYPNLKIIGSSLQADKLIQQIDFKSPIILLAGNEENGLSNYYISKADELAKINMRNNIDSLNVANAITTILYEIDRQRNN